MKLKASLLLASLMTLVACGDPEPQMSDVVSDALLADENTSIEELDELEQRLMEEAESLGMGEELANYMEELENEKNEVNFPPLKTFSFPRHGFEADFPKEPEVLYDEEESAYRIATIVVEEGDLLYQVTREKYENDDPLTEGDLEGYARSLAENVEGEAQEISEINMGRYSGVESTVSLSEIGATIHSRFYLRQDNDVYGISVFAMTSQDFDGQIEAFFDSFNFIDITEEYSEISRNEIKEIDSTKHGFSIAFPSEPTAQEYFTDAGDLATVVYDLEDLKERKKYRVFLMTASGFVNYEELIKDDDSIYELMDEIIDEGLIATAPDASPTLRVRDKIDGYPVIEVDFDYLQSENVAGKSRFIAAEKGIYEVFVFAKNETTLEVEMMDFLDSFELQ